MVMCAYDEDYVNYVQNNIGHMLDYVVNTLDYDIDDFCGMFVNSRVAWQIENGNPKYLVGKTGCELAKVVFRELGKPDDQIEVMYLDRTPEFWTGWVLAYYQWLRNVPYKTIFSIVPASIVTCMYTTLHEADISKFVGIMDAKLDIRK